MNVPDRHQTDGHTDILMDKAITLPLAAKRGNRHEGRLIILTSLAQLLPPCSPTVRNPAPDSSLKSCFSPIASASAAAHRLRPLQLLLPGPIAASASTAAPRLPPPPAAAPDRVRFDCYSPIASASTAAPRLRPLQLLLARLRPLRLLLPDCILDFQLMPRPNVLEHILRGVRGSVNKLKYEGRASL